MVWEKEKERRGRHREIGARERRGRGKEKKIRRSEKSKRVTDEK